MGPRLLYQNEDREPMIIEDEWNVHGVIVIKHEIKYTYYQNGAAYLKGTNCTWWKLHQGINQNIAEKWLRNFISHH